MVEFLLNADPVAGTISNLPALERCGSDVRFTFHRLKAAHSAGFLADVEWSTTLLAAQWNVISARVVADRGATELLHATIPLPNRVFWAAEGDCPMS
jgi:hypothetical protein